MDSSKIVLCFGALLRTGVIGAAYVREGSYNTLLPATSSEEEEEQSSEGSAPEQDGLGKSGKQRARRGRGPFKEEEVRNRGQVNHFVLSLISVDRLRFCRQGLTVTSVMSMSILVGKCRGDRH